MIKEAIKGGKIENFHKIAELHYKIITINQYLSQASAAVCYKVRNLALLY